MTIKNYSRAINKVNGISAQDEQRIRDFLQGAVYCWCKNREDEWFGLSDLMGGPNVQWSGTPMYVLYEKHINQDKSHEDAFDAAAKDGGWLLKRLINDDKREFETKIEKQHREYLWLKPTAASIPNPAIQTNMASTT